MRIPQPKTMQSIQTTRQSGPTKPSQSYQAGGTSGPQGTTGGRARKVTGGKGQMKIGQEMYLWALVLIEVALIGGFRKYFRRFHGG